MSLVQNLQMPSSTPLVLNPRAEKNSSIAIALETMFISLEARSSKIPTEYELSHITVRMPRARQRHITADTHYDVSYAAFTSAYNVMNTLSLQQPSLVDNPPIGVIPSPDYACPYESSRDTSEHT